ncbi:hypothetical protein VTO42DRAFT_6254 [Malbranchea cinnamomea]
MAGEEKYPCAACATFMFSTHFGRTCAKDKNSDKCNNCAGTGKSCVPVPSHLLRMVEEMLKLIRKHDEEAKDASDRVEIRNVLNVMARDFNRSLRVYQHASESEPKVVIDDEGQARVEPAVPPTPTIPENPDENLDSYLLYRAVAALEAQTHATITIRSHLNEIANLLRAQLAAYRTVPFRPEASRTSVSSASASPEQDHSERAGNRFIPRPYPSEISITIVGRNPFSAEDQDTSGNASETAQHTAQNAQQTPQPAAQQQSVLRTEERTATSSEAAAEQPRDAQIEANTAQQQVESVDDGNATEQTGQQRRKRPRQYDILADTSEPARQRRWVELRAIEEARRRMGIRE